MLSGLAPDSMIDETKAANSGGDQPDSFERSVWMKSNPYSGWPRFSMRPYMCTPQSLQAYRWIAALGSTIASLLPFALTPRLSRVTTATCENSAPPAKFFAAGFNPPSTAGCILTLAMVIPPLGAAYVAPNDPNMATSSESGSLIALHSCMGIGRSRRAGHL